MSHLTLTSRERAVLAKVADRPKLCGDVAPEHVDILIGHGLVRATLGHYLITPKGQLERQRQSFRTIPTPERAHVNGRRFLFLQEARFQGDFVPRGRIKAWLRGRRPDGENDVAPAGVETRRVAKLVGRLRAFAASHTRQNGTEALTETPAVPAEPEKTQPVPIPFIDRPKDPASGDETPDHALEQVAEGSY